MCLLETSSVLAIIFHFNIGTKIILVLQKTLVKL